MVAYCLVAPKTGGIVASNERFSERFRSANRPAPRRIDQFAPGLGAKIAELMASDSFPPSLDVEIATPAAGTIAVRLTRLIGDPDDFVLVEIGVENPWQSEAGPLDAVTGLPDRRALGPHRARWSDCPKFIPHAVLFLDLDGFKQVNDQHGHAAGDRVLAELAQRWRRCLREGDLVVRYGGDEFVVLVGHIGKAGDVQPIVDRLEAATRQPFSIGGHSVELSVTVGMATACEPGGCLDDLIATADRNMYAAKIRPRSRPPLPGDSN